MFRTKTMSKSPEKITVVICSSLNEVEWADLALRIAPSLRFLTYGWWQAWADTMLPYDSWRGPLRLMVARSDDGTVQAVLPLAKQVMAGLSVAALAGNYKPFRGWLIAEDAPPETAPAIARFLAEQTDTKALRIGPVECNLAVIRSLKEAFVAAGWKFCRINSATDFLINLPADPDAFQAMLPPRKFKRIRSKRNRLKKRGEVRITCHRDLDPPGWKKAIDEAGRVERTSWFNRLDADLTFADANMAAFWHRYLANPEASRSTSLWILYLDHQPIAYSLMLHAEQCSFSLVGAYDEAFKDYSPGKMIDFDAIHECLERGTKVINMGQGDSGYKADWGAGRQEPLEDWIAFPPKTAGRLLHLVARTKFGPLAA